MDKKNIMEIETDKKEPKKEPKNTSKNLLETLETKKIKKSPYEKAKERYRIA